MWQPPQHPWPGTSPGWNPSQPRGHAPSSHAEHPRHRPSYLSVPSYPPPTYFDPAQHASQSRQLPSASLKHSPISRDVSYHPYRASGPMSSAAANISTGITFVDTNQQAAAAATGVLADGLQQCRPKRKRIMPEQLIHLTAVFDVTDSPSFGQRETLAGLCAMTNREVQIWFQNRRAKVNRQRQALLAKEEAAAMTAAMDASTDQPPVEVAVARAPAETMSAGQHQWRFRPKKGIKTEQGFEGSPSPIPPQPSPPFQAVISAPPLADTSPCPSPPLALGEQRPVSFGPLSSPIFTPAASWSYFDLTSPPLTTASVTTASSSSASSYFSRQDGPYTPSTMSSPSGYFSRLALHSPQITPRSPHPAPDMCAPTSPRSHAREEPIHLAPIRSDAILVRLAPTRSPLSRPMHRRSISDSAAQAVLAVIATQQAGKPAQAAHSPRLPSLRGLLNDDEHSPATTRPPVLASAPTTPVDAHHPAFPASTHIDVRLTMVAGSPSNRSPLTPQRPPLVSRYSTIDIHRKPSVERKTQLSSSPTRSDLSKVVRPFKATTASTGVDGAAASGDVPMRSSTPMSGSVGLGMLVAAASELCEDDEQAALFAASSQMH